MSADPSPAFNLEHLKKTAKRLLRACRAGDASAISLIQESLPSMRALDATAVPAQIQLADVQHALAVQQGFTSWPALTRFRDPLSRLLIAVRGGHTATLRHSLKDFVGLADVNACAASALGNVPALERHLATDARRATEPHEGWRPLDYVCGSPVARFSARHAMSLCACAEVLLRSGADPNAAVADDGSALGGMAPMMRAAANANIALVMLLKKHGAGEPGPAMRQWLATRQSGDMSKFQGIFREYFQRPDVKDRMQQAMAEMKAQHGSRPAGPVDWREVQHLRLPHLVAWQAGLRDFMFDRSHDLPHFGQTGQSPVHTMIANAPTSFVELFLSRGGDATARDADGHSVIACAVRAGNTEAAECLRAHGVADDATRADRLIGACRSGHAERARHLVSEDPGLVTALMPSDLDVLVRAAGRGDIAQVSLMLDIGISPDSRDEAGAAALHQAAWRGQVEMIRLLLSRGASARLTDGLYGQTPREWAMLGAVQAPGAAEGCGQAAQILNDTDR